ncbi:MAG TPA: carboxymuconolactone decarboxylase family protein [Zeimonas sp.]
MARIPYVPADLTEPREIVDAVRARRGGTLLNLDRMLLHSPELAAGWNAFLGAVRNRLALPPKLRELAMCVVAVLNDAEYEFIQHAPEFRKAGGTQAQLDALREPEKARSDEANFDATERAALAVAIASTRSVHVPESDFAALAQRLGERETVEFVATVATYNMVSRFLVALGVEPE